MGDLPRMDLSLPDVEMLQRIMDPDTTHIVLSGVVHADGTASASVFFAGTEDHCDFEYDMLGGSTVVVKAASDLPAVWMEPVGKIRELLRGDGGDNE